MAITRLNHAVLFVRDVDGRGGEGGGEGAGGGGGGGGGGELTGGPLSRAGRGASATGDRRSCQDAVRRGSLQVQPGAGGGIEVLTRYADLGFAVDDLDGHGHGRGVIGELLPGANEKSTTRQLSSSWRLRLTMLCRRVTGARRSWTMGRVVVIGAPPP